jgi:NAD(P)-dependent dehydrogenase (short-subunit alcohol dehydrogenase family)
MRHLGRITRPATRASAQRALLNHRLAASHRAFTTSSQPKPLPPPPLPSHPSRPNTHLLNKVAIVTGAGSRSTDNTNLGNGAATALLLAEAGAAVLCVDKHLSLAEHTASLITNREEEENPLPLPGQAIAVEADVTNPAECAQIIHRALAAFGRLDILINVVGILGARGTAVDVDLAEWNRGMEVNVTSMMLMAKYAVPAMLRDKPVVGEGRPGEVIRGSIVNVGSVAGLRGGTAHLLYPTSKGAVVNMTRAMAAQHGREGVRVNCVCPGEFLLCCFSSNLGYYGIVIDRVFDARIGMLYTPMMFRGGMTEEMRERRRQRSLLGTEGNAWDCAHAIRFLAGDEARWITGAVLTVDAGATAAVSLSPEA